MFIKLTRLDNTPIWINASFVVTVEPRKGGGAIVVPIGDGLDYDVREMPEAVLGLLGDAPAPAVVPVPAPPGLAPKGLGLDAKPAASADVTDTADAAKETTATASAAPAAPGPKKTTRSRAKAKAAVAAGSTAGSATPSDRATAATAEEAETAADDKSAAKKPRSTRKAKKVEESLPVLPLSEDELARLRKLAPGSVRKLQNTLAAQFRTLDTEAAVAALEANEILSLDRERVIWK